MRADGTSRSSAGCRVARLSIAAGACLATVVVFHAATIAWVLAILRCPMPVGFWPAGHLPPLVAIVVGLVGSVVVLRRVSRPPTRALVRGMLAGWVILAVLALAVREVPVACALHGG